MRPPDTYDLAVIGGGINGCGIAADAAGRGMTVLLAEAGDLGAATSSASSKLIHGGLRYLEQYAFRLVRESLGEREVLLARAPHIIWPVRFLLPHMPGLRPRWMLRAGLTLYDHLHRRRAVPGSAAVRLASDPGGRALRPALTHGFAYWDCWVDDARLVILNARQAADRGAQIHSRRKVLGARADRAVWRVALAGDRNGETKEIRARALINAAGPWVAAVAPTIERPGQGRPPTRVRLVKGSHIVVPRISATGDAYLLQSPDRRIVFALPFEDRFTLIGTTDQPFEGDPGRVAIDETEIAYLIEIANRFLRSPLKRADVVWTFAGVRPLYDDSATDPSTVTRDYRLDLTVAADAPPLLTVIGGKVTTHRRLAEEALAKLAPYLPGVGAPWTANRPLPGGDLEREGELVRDPRTAFTSFLDRLAAELPGFDRAWLARLTRRHGSLVREVIDDARRLADMGALIGPDLTAREVLYLKEREWAASAEDILWRRTKAGLHLAADERERARETIAALL